MDAAVLTDYWLGVLAKPDEDAVEEHLLACDLCGERLREVIALAEGVRKVAREGWLHIVVSDEFLKRAAQDGLRIREYTVPNGGSVQCTVTAEDDLLIGRLELGREAENLREAKRVDLSLYDGNGQEQVRMPDIPVSSGATSVVLQVSAPLMKGAPDSVLIARLVALDDAGTERPLGEYTFNHTRSMPGPSAW